MFTDRIHNRGKTDNMSISDPSYWIFKGSHRFKSAYLCVKVLVENWTELEKKTSKRDGLMISYSVYFIERFSHFTVSGN